MKIFQSVKKYMQILHITIQIWEYFKMIRARSSPPQTLVAKHNVYAAFFWWCQDDVPIKKRILTNDAEKIKWAPCFYISQYICCSHKWFTCTYNDELMMRSFSSVIQNNVPMLHTKKHHISCSNGNSYTLLSISDPGMFSTSRINLLSWLRCTLNNRIRTRQGSKW